MNNHFGRASVHKDGNRYPIDPVKLAIIHRMHQYRMAQIHAQHMALIHQNEISQRNEYNNHEDIRFHPLLNLADHQLFS